MQNKPNAVCMLGPKSPRLVHTNVTSPFSRALSKLIVFTLLHNIFFTPEYLNKLSNCDVACVINFSVSALFGAFL